MSCFLLEKREIDLLTCAVDCALRLNKKYSGSYPLHPETVNLLGRYAGDAHSLYRALFIANIRAVNGRYGDDITTLPRYTPLTQWSCNNPPRDRLKAACGAFGCYMYQISEDPVYKSPVYDAFNDLYSLVCRIYTKITVDWSGNDA